MEIGSLYIVATPIGNLQDITLRALETLKNVDIVLCEDTRLTGKLLNHFKIKKPLRLLNDFNEETVSYQVLDLLVDGKQIALVSDAGTPLISDPGFRLVRLAREHSITVIPIPGPTSVISALSASGFPSDSFLFIGFLPKGANKKTRLFNNLKTTYKSQDLCPTLIFFESPYRLVETLQLMLKELGDIEVVLARELTKIHEEFIQKPLSILVTDFEKKKPKGEFVVLLSLK